MINGQRNILSWMPALLLAACMSAGDAAAQVPKGMRILGLDTNPAQDNDYEAAFVRAQSTGMQAVPLSFDWTDIEILPRLYSNGHLATADHYYPPRNMKVTLVIRPVHGTCRLVPQDLGGLPLSDPLVIARFNTMMDYVFSQIPHLQLTSLAIGNEVDSYLGTSTTLWEEFRVFYQQTSAYARSKRPGVLIGTTATFQGLTVNNGANLIQLNGSSDVIMATYYPVNADFTVQNPSMVGADFDRITELYEGKQIFIMEAGYPTSSYCGSSEDSQRAFIEQVFKAWDDHAAQIQYLSFLRLHDISSQLLEAYASYYGIHTIQFLEYLRTLGLRSDSGSGTNKLGLAALTAEAFARGWSDLSGAAKPAAPLNLNIRIIRDAPGTLRPFEP